MITRECQVCASRNLESVVFLGYMPPVNTMLDSKSLPNMEERYPLEMLRCSDCGLCQIGYVVPQSILFPISYPYLSGSTRILRENFKEQSRRVVDLVGLDSDDLVVDIGSNDGTLLVNYNPICRVVGVEPTMAADVATANSINTRKQYFNISAAVDILKDFGPAKVVTACNVFAHIDDVHEVMRGIVTMLRDDDGVFVSESHYLPSLVQTLQYDTIYHEHLRYYHLGALVNLFEMSGMEVFHAELIQTHGGSIRVFASKRGNYPVTNDVEYLLAKEVEYGITDGGFAKRFRADIAKSRIDLLSLLHDIQAIGKKIYGIGAPSRASTLINYVGLDGILDAVMEVSSSHKLGKFIPGTRIPVVDEQALYDDQPPYAMILSWHIAEELMSSLREKGYKGQFIVPLPTARIVN